VSEAHWRYALGQTHGSGPRRCEVSRGAGEPPGPRVECHERWELDDGAGVAVLAGLQAWALPHHCLKRIAYFFLHCITCLDESCPPFRPYIVL